MLTFKSYIRLQEELTPEQKASVSKWKRDPKALKHTDHFFGKGNDDVHEPLQGGVQKSEPHTAIERHLGHEISHEDYKAGLTKDKYGRQVRIGALLQKSKADPELMKQFMNDSTRQLKGQSKLNVHVTRSAAGVAGQTSQGQSWEQQSCKNFEDGSNKHYLKHEVQHGTVVAYLKDHHGNELARQTFQPYHSKEGKVVYRKNGYYGPNHAEFNKHCDDIEKRLSASHEPSNKVYSIHPKVYNDRGIDRTLHPNTTKEHIDTALKDKNSTVRRVAIQHPNATADHITKALKDVDSDVRRAAIKNPNATAEHITHALKDEDRNVRLAAIRNPNATKEHIDTALKDNNSTVRWVAIQHPNATADHITKALKHKDSYIREIALQHPNATADHITHALKDKDSYIRQIAIRHPNATADHITHALNDKDKNVRLIAIQHPNATADHITHALNDKHPDVRWAAREAQKKLQAKK